MAVAMDAGGMEKGTCCLTLAEDVPERKGMV
jgi:hypothetical protein